MSTMATEKQKNSSRLKRFLSIFKLTREGATPVKWSIVIVVTLALFGSAFVLTFVFAFLPFMVLVLLTYVDQLTQLTLESTEPTQGSELPQDFGYREEDKGYYVGVIVASYFSGRAVGSFFWGWLADKKGRRPVMIANLLLNAVLTPAFGFSTSIWMACLFRFLGGLMTGIITTAKTILYEISDTTNQAAAYSCLALCWGFGIIIGPAVGGYLSYPAEKYPSVFTPDGLFAQFPFLLPCIIASIITTLGAILVFFKLPETLHKKKEKQSNTKNDSLLDETHKDGDMTRISSELYHGNGEAAMRSLDDMAMLFAPSDMLDASLYRMKSDAYIHYVSNQRIAQKRKESIEKDENISNLVQAKRKVSLSAPDLMIRVGQQKRLQELVLAAEADTLLKRSGEAVNVDDSELKKRSCWWRFRQSCKNSVMGKLYRLQDVRLTIAVYSIFSFCVIGFEEVLGVWASTEPRLDGLGFSSNQMGNLAMMVSIPILFLQMVIFSKLEGRFGIKKVCLVFSFLLCISSTLIPILHLIYDKDELLWCSLFLILAPHRVAVMCVFTSLGLFINNSVSPALAGSLNGLALTLSALARMIAPLFGGSIFAWSITSGLYYPFDVNFVFLLFGLSYGVTHVMTLFIPAHLNVQSKREIIIDETESPKTEDKHDKVVIENEKMKNGGNNSKYKPRKGSEENANEDNSQEWSLKEKQTVAIVERNVNGNKPKGEDRSTAF